MSLAKLLAKRADIALVIGNGVNRYQDRGNATSPGGLKSWDTMLERLASEHLGKAFAKIPHGVALTEFYDLLDLSRPSGSSVSLQQKFCDLMLRWRHQPQHERIVTWAKAAGVPILTTNFERTLADAGGHELHRTNTRAFTDYYPWDSYYGSQHMTDPCSGFGIWHINGMARYRRSIRLGLTHYMGSVERARAWIHKGGARRLFGNGDPAKWAGATTWLHVVFNRPLVFFGLGLEENEVFLRWLLIERARYFRKFPARKLDAWFVHTAGSPVGPGKNLFLRTIGITPLEVASYDEIYGSAAWGF